MQQRLSSVPSLHNSSHVSFSFLSYRLVDSSRRNKLIRLVITTLNVQRYLFHGYLFYFGLIFRLNYLSLLPQIFFLILISSSSNFKIWLFFFFFTRSWKSQWRTKIILEKYLQINYPSSYLLSIFSPLSVLICN